MTRMVLLLVLAVLAGCSSGGDEVDGGKTDGEQARRALVQQRLDVRSGARDLLAALEDRLDGTTSHSSGQYRGCEGAFNDQFQNFRYLAQARVDVSDAVSADDLARVLEQAGFSGAEPTTGPGGSRSRRGRSGDVAAVLTTYDGQPYVLVDVSGPCVQVPDDQRDAWANHDEPSPDLR